MRSGNPSLKVDIFKKQGTSSDRMTVDGTVNKSFFLIILVMFSALIPWFLYNDGVNVFPIAMASLILGFIVAMVTIFSPKISRITAPIYAILEGLAIGAISAFYEAKIEGITQQAVLLTFGVFCALLATYKSRLIKPNQNFRLGVVAATGGIALVYVFNFILSFFGLGIPFIHEATLIGILFSIGVVIIAALNLVLDFDFIEKGADYGAPKYMEWYGAFGLIMTLIWLYIEILHLLAKIASRD